MATITHDNLAVCIDCAGIIANGEGPDDVAEALGNSWGMRIVLSCGEDCEGWFSWSACDGCGSSLGGERHPAVVFGA